MPWRERSRSDRSRPRCDPPDRAEQVAVGNDAQPLVPRVVAGREVGRRHRSPPAAGAAPLRSAPAWTSPGHRLLSRYELWVTSAFIHRSVGALPTPGHDRRMRRGRRVDAGQRCDVGRRALQHRDVFGPVGHGRHEGDRGGAAADHHHAPVGRSPGPRASAAGGRWCRRSRPGRGSPGRGPGRSGSSRCTRTGTNRSARPVRPRPSASVRSAAHLPRSRPRSTSPQRRSGGGSGCGGRSRTPSQCRAGSGGSRAVTDRTIARSRAGTGS